MKTNILCSSIFVASLIFSVQMPLFSQERASTLTKQKQAAITPKQAFQMLKEGNKRFLTGKVLERNHIKHVKETSHGQYPFAAIVACIDSRTSPELIFDQGIGDVFNARVAGNIVNEDILGSLEYAAKVSGSKLIVVLGHTHCGAIKGACDDVKLGHLTGLIGKIKPAIDAIPASYQPRTSSNHEFVEEVSEMNVELMMKQIYNKSQILKEMIDKEEVGLIGAMYYVETGRVIFYEN